MRRRENSGAGHPADERLKALFKQLDTDRSGALSLQELGKALQTNREFAVLMGASGDGDKPLSPLAANLIATNLRKVADRELGDCDGEVSELEFVRLCRSLVPSERLGELPAAAAAATAPAQELATNGSGGCGSSAGSGGGGGKAASVAGSGGRRGKIPTCGLFSSSASQSRSAAAASARTAEGRLGALQKLLHEDVVSSLEALLETASAEPDDAAKAALYHRGVCDVLSACRRLADTSSTTADAEGGGGGGSSGSADPNGCSAEALEVMSLRRDLATTKVALAEAMGERQALEHQVRVVGSAQAGRARRSLFG